MSFSQFVKPYPDGYIDTEAGDTPVTAEILNTNYDGFLLALNEFLPELEGMVEANPSEAATAGNLTKLKVGNSIYLIPSGGSGGSTVVWDQIQLTGTKIATITIDDVPVDVYAPSGGGSGDEVSWTQVLGSGTEIGTITINDTPITVYAPTPIDVEANPSGSATAGDLTKLKVGSGIYSIPSGGSGGSGHTILDDDGTELAQEDDLQFKGVYTTDNSTDGVTEVNVYREMTRSEFNALSSDEKKGFIRTTDEPDIYSDGHFQPVIYSTEEREIGVWTDGKPLYKRTFEFDANDLQTEANGKYINFSIPNIDKLCLSDIVIESGDIKLPFYTSASNYISNFNTISTDIAKFSFRYGNDVASYLSDYFANSKAHLYYTKSTDVAGSGSWTPQGVPTHKYSTEEHIIGTWIDGSTIYEKTYVSNTEIQITATNLGNDITSLIDNLSVMAQVVNCFATNESANGFMPLVADNSGNRFVVYTFIGNAFKTLTVQYTKSS